MNTPAWLQALAPPLLGRDPQLRRHVWLVLASSQIYVVSIAVVLHSLKLGLLNPGAAHLLLGAWALSFFTVLALVRSGVTHSWSDPVLAFPHAVASVALGVLAYALLGPYRANVMILIAQTIVLAMFRLSPRKMFQLGLIAVTLLSCAMMWLTWQDPAKYPSSTSWTHFSVGGSTLLMLSIIAKWVSDIRVRIGKQAQELERALHAVQKMATKDMLTGLSNRRVMTDAAEHELRLIDRHATPLTIALLDIDHFKHINDLYGHRVGDDVLKAFAELAAESFRGVDLVGRWGGEEFLILMPHVSQADGIVALERLRANTASLAWADKPDLRVRFSAGVAQAHSGESLSNLVERADKALYKAKREGRDMIRGANLHEALA